MKDRISNQNQLALPCCIPSDVVPEYTSPLSLRPGRSSGRPETPLDADSQRCRASLLAAIPPQDAGIADCVVVVLGNHRCVDDCDGCLC